MAKWALQSPHTLQGSGTSPVGGGGGKLSGEDHVLTLSKYEAQENEHEPPRWQMLMTLIGGESGRHTQHQARDGIGSKAQGEGFGESLRTKP